jgi:hypothetical protein
MSGSRNPLTLGRAHVPSMDGTFRRQNFLRHTSNLSAWGLTKERVLDCDSDGLFVCVLHGSVQKSASLWYFAILCYISFSIFIGFVRSSPPNIRLGSGGRYVRFSIYIFHT